MLKKAYECLHMPTISASLQGLLNLLEAVIIEVCTVQVLRLRTNPQQVHKTKYLPPTKLTQSHTGFHNGQASQGIFNLSYDQKYCSFSDHTNVICDLQLYEPYIQRLRHVNHSQVTSIAFLHGSRLPIQHSYTELQVTVTVWQSAHLATALLHWSTSHAPQAS